MDVTRIKTFDAAHRLMGHNGKCKNLHGHTYKVEVTYNGFAERSHDLDDAMVVDFGTIDEGIDEVVDDLDHSCLNDKMDGQPTAEALVIYFVQRLSHKIDGAKLKKVRVWETPKSHAEMVVP